jgi:outer membrane immunogenic protein
MRTLSKWFLAAALMALLHTSVAHAQKLGEGCYVSGHAGMVASDAKADLLVPTTSMLAFDGLGASGQMYGGQVGCDFKVNGFVFGAFANGNLFRDADFTLSTPFLGGASITTGLDWGWAAGARLGVLFGDRTLLYGLAAYNELKMKDLTAACCGGSIGFDVPTMKGFQLGGGVEQDLGSGFSLKAEYRYSFLEGQTASVIPGVLNVDLEPKVQTFTVGGVYRFNFLK